MHAFHLRLTHAEMLTPSIRHMFFERTDGQPLRYLPGQFVQLHFENDAKEIVRRSYSLASRTSGEDLSSSVVEFVVSYVPGGPGTCLMSSLNPGDEVKAAGPLGRLCLMPDDDNDRYVLIGTGTGIVPYRAMLDQLDSIMAMRSLQVVLLHGARSVEELLFADEFQQFADAHPNFTYMPCLSREDCPTAHAHGLKGYVQDGLEQLQLDAEQDIAYLCGNPNMVDACFDTLKNRGLALTNIRREKYVSPKPMPKPA